MRNSKITLRHAPEEGVYLFQHTPTRLEFAVVGKCPEAYLNDCVKFPDRKDTDELHPLTHLTVLEDFKIITRYNFSEFVFHPICPGQVEKTLAFIRGCPCLEEPEIVITESMFKHIYGMDRNNENKTN